MRRLASSKLLAAFAESRERVSEALDEHLIGVAQAAYKLLAPRDERLARVAAMAGLLHDVGKALEPYQECLTGRKRCSYIGHEVLSEYIGLSVLSETQSLDDDAKSLVLYAVRYHHQYFGPPSERFQELLKRLGSSRATQSLYSRESLENIKLLAEQLEHRIESTSVEPLREILADVARAMKNTGTLYKAIVECVQRKGRATRLTQRLSRMNKPSLWLKARVLAGTLIVADKHAAGLNRRGSSKFQNILEAYERLFNISKAP